MTKKEKKRSIGGDVTLSWVDDTNPELANWRDYAVAWIASSSASKIDKRIFIKIFFEQYLLRLNLPMQISSFLQASEIWPKFSDSILHVKLTNRRLVACNDHIADFLSWVLVTHFSETDSLGNSIPVAGFCNPIRRIQKVADRNIDDQNLRPHNDK
ncbi:MAG: hypothetical protein EOO10_15390, partial [Chitinophagaceae bacterium]